MSLFLKIIKLIINIITFIILFLILPLGFILNSISLILDLALTDIIIPKEEFYRIFIEYFKLVRDRIKAIWDE